MELDPYIERFALTTSRMIDENLHTGVSVGELADAAGYSPFHFSRLFAKVFRTSPTRYVSAVRFHRAKQLLLTQDHPVIDVCHEVGFNSLATFSRRFLQAVAVTPGNLRCVADRLGETEIPAFALGDQAAVATGRVIFTPEQRAALRDDLVHREPLVWIGTYPQPVPLGRPASGVLRRGEGEFCLPITTTAPWVLATAYPASADPAQQLAASVPMVGMYPGPVRVTPGEVRGGTDIHFRTALPWDHPVLTALPSLAGAPS